MQDRRSAPIGPPGSGSDAQTPLAPAERCPGTAPPLRDLPAAATCSSADHPHPHSHPHIVAYRDWIALLLHDLFAVLEDGFAQAAANQPLAEVQRWVLEQTATSLVRRAVQSAPIEGADDTVSGEYRPLLTPRQREVLLSVSHAGDCASAALDLGVSVHTIRTHIRDACSRLQVSGRDAAVRRARALALIP